MSRCRTGASRKMIFDDFLSQAPSLSPLVQSRFDASKSAIAEYGYSPLRLYLEGEGLRYDQIADLLRKVAEGASKSVMPKREEVVSRIWGVKDVDYSYGYQAIKARNYEDLEKHLKRIKPIHLFKRTLDSLGLQCSAVISEHPGFFRSHSPFAINIPRKRTSYVFVPSAYGKYGQISTTFHELGHALEDTYRFVIEDVCELINDKYVGPNSELFSLLFESLLRDEVYLADFLKIQPDVIGELQNRQRFMFVFFLAFCSTRSIFKLNFLNDSMSVKDSIDHFGYLADKYYIPSLPGAYWLLDLYMTTHDLDTPNYVIGSIQAEILRRYLQTEFQRDWWRSQDAGAFIRRVAGSLNQEPWIMQFNHRILFDNDSFLSGEGSM